MAESAVLGYGVLVEKDRLYYAAKHLKTEMGDPRDWTVFVKEVESRGFYVRQVYDGSGKEAYLLSNQILTIEENAAYGELQQSMRRLRDEEAFEVMGKLFSLLGELEIQDKDIRTSLGMHLCFPYSGLEKE